MNQTQLKYALGRVDDIQQSLEDKAKAQTQLSIIEEPVQFSTILAMLKAIKSGEIDLTFPERDVNMGSFYNMDDFVLPKGYLDKLAKHEQSEKDASAKFSMYEEKIRLECDRVRDSIALGTADESVQALQDLNVFTFAN